MWGLKRSATTLPRQSQESASQSQLALELMLGKPLPSFGADWFGWFVVVGFPVRWLRGKRLPARIWKGIFSFLAKVRLVEFADLPAMRALETF
jgi:hypothetical protein